MGTSFDLSSLFNIDASAFDTSERKKINQDIEHTCIWHICLKVSGRVGRFLMDMVKTYGLNRRVKNRFLTPKCQKPPRNIVKNWIIGTKLSFLNIFIY